MSINEYFTKLKGLVYSLGSIGALVDDEDLVSMILNGLRREYAQFQTCIGVRETFPDSQELVALLLSEEQRNGGSTTRSSAKSTFYSNQDKGRGHFGGCSRTNSNNRKTNPMEEDVVTLEARATKEDLVHGKGTSR